MSAENTFGLTRRGLLQAGAVASLLKSSTAFAAGLDSVKLSLEFVQDGGTGPDYYGIDHGIYRRLGLQITPEPSSGSAASIGRVAAGTYDFGMADASTLVEFACKNPGKAPKLVMPIYDKFPAVILSLSRKPVTSLKQLTQVKLGVGTADAGSQLLPALLKLNHIDPKSIHPVTVDIKLRDALLLKGGVDAVVAFDYTAVFNLMGNGVKLKDIHLLYFYDSGFDFVGNSLIVNPKVASEKPDLVRRVATGIARTWVESEKHRAAAVASVINRNQLLNPKTELARLNWVYDKLVLTPNVKKNGLGAVTKDRVERSITFIKNGLNAASAPTADELMASQFMPPLKDRKIA